jgi:hypothetical protein
MGMCGQSHAPAALPSGMRRSGYIYTVYIMNQFLIYFVYTNTILVEFNVE